MSELEEILTILQEECAEVIVEVSKIKRFGCTDKNKHRLKKEIADVLTMMDILNRQGTIALDDEEMNQMIQQKKDKLLEYSKLYRWL